jgi:hypothetical protein
MNKVSIENMSFEEIGEAVDQALKEVAAEYEAGTLDLSGRYYTDAELAEIKARREDSARAKTGPVKAGTAA